MGNRHVNENITFVYYIMRLYAVCCDAGAADIYRYIYIKLVMNKCRYEVGLPRLFKTILVHFFVVLCNDFGCGAIYMYVGKYICAVCVLNYTHLCTTCLCTTHSAKIYTLRPKMHLQTSLGILLYNTLLNKSHLKVFLCFISQTFL